MAYDNEKDKYTATIKVQNDTVAVVGEQKAYYSPDDNTIMINKGDISFDNGFKPDENVLIIHERQHQINHQRKSCYDAPMSLSEFYQIEMHDEITASIAEKLEIRRQYKQTKTAEEKKAFFAKFAKDKKNSAYVMAIQNGNIDPNSTSAADMEKEMAFIKDSATDYWLKHDAYGYQKNQTLRAISFLQENGNNVYSNPSSVSTKIKSMYNIGNIDFSKYGRDNRQLPIINNTLLSADNMLSKGANPQKLARFIKYGGNNYSLAEGLDLSGLSREQAEKVVQTAIVVETVSSEISGALAMGEKPSLDFDNIAQSSKRQVAVYIDVKSDIWEKEGTLSATGNEEKFNALMKQVKTVKLDPQQWFEENKSILICAKDPNRRDELESLKNKISELQGKSINFDDTVDMNKFRLPLGDASTDEVLDAISRQEEEDAKFREEYSKEHPEDKRISAPYEKEVMDLESDILKDELQARREAEKKIEPLTVGAQSLQYIDTDGITARLRTNIQYTDAEIKMTTNVHGEKTEVTYLDGKKHGAEIIYDSVDNVKDIKLYDNGEEIDINTHRVDFKHKVTEDGKVKATQVLLDGKPFGTTKVESDEKIKVDFYDRNGDLISGKENATMRVTTEHQNNEEATDISVDEEKELSEKMIKAHDRITAMREKLASGHTDTTSTFRETKLQSLQALRLEEVRTVRATNKLPITVDMLRRQLANREIDY